MRVATVDNGKLTFVEAPSCANGEYYEWQREFVGGYIEVVMIASREPNGGTLQLIGNDESALHHKRPSFAWQRRYPWSAKGKVHELGFAYGPVIIEHVTADGRTVALADSDVARINKEIANERWAVLQP